MCTACKRQFQCGILTHLLGYRMYVFHGIEAYRIIECMCCGCLAVVQRAAALGQSQWYLHMAFASLRASPDQASVSVFPLLDIAGALCSYDMLSCCQGLHMLTVAEGIPRAKAYLSLLYVVVLLVIKTFFTGATSMQKGILP